MTETTPPEPVELRWPLFDAILLVLIFSLVVWRVIIELASEILP